MIKVLLFAIVWTCILLASFKLLHRHKHEEELLAENMDRLKRASQYLKGAEYTVPKELEFVLAIITAPRRYGAVNLDYFTQVLGSFMAMIESENICNVGIFICDASGDKLNAAKLSKAVGVWNIASYENVAVHAVEKELLDYISCLEALQMKYPVVNYVLLNEDDAIPKQGFFKNVMQIIRQLQLYASKVELNDVSFVKLYHPERFRKLPFLIYLVTFPLTLAALAHYISHFWHQKIRFYILALIFVVASASMVVLGPDLVGVLHHKLRLGYVPLVPAESCCTPSVLYSKSMLNQTISYLRGQYAADKALLRLRAKDTILDDLSYLTSMRSLMTEFDFVEHIGFYSTLHKKF